MKKIYSQHFPQKSKHFLSDCIYQCFLMMDSDSAKSLTYIGGYAIQSNYLIIGFSGTLLALKLLYELRKFVRSAHQENYLKAYGKKLKPCAQT